MQSCGGSGPNPRASARAPGAGAEDARGEAAVQSSDICLSFVFLGIATPPEEAPFSKII